MSQTFRSFRYFGKEYTFDEWVRREILKNKGTDNIAQTKNCYAPLYDLTEICQMTDEDMQALLEAYPKQVRRKKPVPSQPYQQEDYEPEEEIER